MPLPSLSFLPPLRFPLSSLPCTGTAMDAELFSHGVLLLEQHRTKARPTIVRHQWSSPPPAETWPPSSSLPFERSSSRRSPSQPNLPRALPRIHSRPPRPPSSPKHCAASRCPMPPARADRVKEDALQRAPSPGHPAIPSRPASAKAISLAAQAVLDLPRPSRESPRPPVSESPIVLKHSKCEDSFDNVASSSLWTRSSSKQDLRKDDHFPGYNYYHCHASCLVSIACHATYHLFVKPPKVP